MVEITIVYAVYMLVIGIGTYLMSNMVSATALLPAAFGGELGDGQEYSRRIWRCGVLCGDGT